MWQEIDPCNLSSWTQACATQGLTPIVLDVREDWEYQTSNIEPLAATLGITLQHVPMGRIPGALNALPREGACLACLCHHGVRSVQVSRFLSQIGYRHIANVTGGIEAVSDVYPDVPRY